MSWPDCGIWKTYVSLLIILDVIMRIVSRTMRKPNREIQDNYFRFEIKRPVIITAVGQINVAPILPSIWVSAWSSNVSFRCSVPSLCAALVAQCGIIIDVILMQLRSVDLRQWWYTSSSWSHLVRNTIPWGSSIWFQITLNSVIKLCPECRTEKCTIPSLCILIRIFCSDETDILPGHYFPNCR